MGAKLQAPHTEGFCNKLHYRITFILLIGCSLMVTCLEWVGAGKKIACVMEGPDDSWTIPLNVINTYCYVMTTFTLPKHWTTKQGIENAQPGVGDFNPRTDEVHYKAYYQWVSFVLFFQALTFYAPHYIFKVMLIRSNSNSNSIKIFGDKLVVVFLQHFILLDMGRWKGQERYCWIEPTHSGQKG